MKHIAVRVSLAGLLFMSSVGVVHAVQPTVSTSGGNTPFSTVMVSGAGFAPNEQVLVMLGLNTVVVHANSEGVFSGATLTIPNYPAGLYLILAIGQSSGLPAFTYFYVSSLYPIASPSAWYISPGSTLTWSGSGFAPNEHITINLGTSTIATFSADAFGAFSQQGFSVVPYALRNSVAAYSLHATTSNMHTNFYVGVANLYPYANPSTWYTLPGTEVTFSGAGFGPGEDILLYQSGSTTPLKHWSSDNAGAFAAEGATLIPFLTPSPVTYTLVGAQSGASATVPITLAQFYPSLQPSSYYGAPGSYISLAGSGFASNELVIVTFGSATSTAQTDAFGVFTIPSLRLPKIPNTTALVSAVGEKSGATTNFTMAIGAYYAWMTLNSYWAQGGSELSIFGHSFLPGEEVTFSSGSTHLGTTTANISGDFTMHTTTPFAPPGPTTIEATGVESGATALGTMTVAPVYTDLQLQHYVGAPGDALTFIGHGYLPQETMTLTSDRTGSSTLASWQTDTTGSFTYSGFALPNDFAEGNLTLTVSSAHSFDTKSIAIYVTDQ